MNQNNFKIIGASVTTVMLMIGAYVLLLSDKADTTTKSTNSTAVVSVTPTPTVKSSDADTQSQTPATAAPVASADPQPVASESTAKDYSVTIDYEVPKGDANSLSVSMTIKDGIITNLNTESKYQDHESISYINDFAGSIKSKVVGKKLSDINLSRVGGASLTTGAFQDAVDQISLQI